MSDRGVQLRRQADTQIGELIELVSRSEESALRVRCPGREKLGDGTVAACAAHTAANYLRIAAFLAGEARGGGAHRHATGGLHRIGRLLRGRGHATSHDHTAHDAHGAPDAAPDLDRAGVLGRLAAGRQALARLPELSDEQLDSVPAASEMRFCDGQRTLEQIVQALLKHQSHQVDTVRSVLA